MGKPFPVGGTIAIVIMIFLILTYLMGFTIGKGILNMLRNIPIVVWFFIFLFIFYVTMKGKK